METLLGVRHLTRHSSYMLNFDLHYGLFAMGIGPEFRDNSTIKVRGHLYRLADYRWGGPYNLSLFSPHGDLRSPPSDSGPSELHPLWLLDTTLPQAKALERSAGVTVRR
jgi:hypothetical protein